MQVKILTIIRHTSDIWSFRMERPDGFTFKPGQFLLLSDTLHGQDVRRAYSISSSPQQNTYVEITVRLKPDGIYTPTLFSKIPGDMLEMKGPFGIFHYDMDDTRIPIFIAGGTGIAPLLSMLRYYLTIPPTSSEAFYLFYGIRKEDDEVFKEELAELTLQHERFNEIIAVGEPNEHWQGERGNMNFSIIKQYVVDPKTCVFYICGPEAMVHHIIEDLHSHGITDNQVKLDHW